MLSTECVSKNRRGGSGIFQAPRGKCQRIRGAEIDSINYGLHRLCRICGLPLLINFEGQRLESVRLPLLRFDGKRVKQRTTKQALVTAE